MLYIGLGIYIFLINVFAVIVTIKDKKLAINHKWRIKERTLLLIAIFGGSIAMLITMFFIRHKIRKLKFMIGIPIIIILQITITAIAIYFA